MSRTSVWITLPKTAWPTASGSTSARLTASRTTVAARSHGGTDARPPPYLRSRSALRTGRIRHAGCWPRLLRSHVQAAVDGPDLPGDIGGLVGRQEADDPGDLLRLPETAQRDLAPDPVHHLVGDGGHHVGRDVAGRDRVDGQPDPVAGRALRPVELEDGFPRQ